MTAEPSFLIAFIAGVLSFFSPCILPLFPSYLSFITGLDIEELNSDHTDFKRRVNIILHSLGFVTGLSFIYISLGASSSFIGFVFIKFQAYFRIIGGAIIISFGIFILLGQKIPYLLKEIRFSFRNRPTGFLGSLVIGIAFAAGWTPCIGPIITSLLIYASTTANPYKGAMLLGFFSAGMGVPFLLSSIALGLILEKLTMFKKIINYLTIISGFVMVLAGILLISGYFKYIGEFINSYI